MNCCPDPAATAALADGAFEATVVHRDGRAHFEVAVPDIHCAACIGRIEGALARLPGLERARVNFGAKRVALDWRGDVFRPEEAVRALRDLGYAPRPFDPAAPADDPCGGELLRALGVAGFAAMNVMLLSVSVWAGADGATRDLLQWFSALVALPAVVYAGRPFFRPAWHALRAGRLGMDVPISLAVLLAAGLSLYETVAGAGDTYFDAAVTLLFFLLIGRWLDHLMRTRARASVADLARFAAPTALLVEGGATRIVAADTLAPGALVRLAAGSRAPADGEIVTGAAAFDLSLATGEAAPVTRRPGETILAGALALDGPVDVRVTRAPGDSFLAEMHRLMGAAEAVRSRPMLIADRAARVYAPAVHLLALAALAGWLVAGAPFHTAITVAIAVLIITCPCALGLAVPAVQVVACDLLFRRGLAVKDGGALERIAGTDTLVLDKTGTLTTAALDPDVRIDDESLAAAAALARHSLHPAARAVTEAAAVRGLALPPAKDVREHPGQGVTGRIGGRPARFGSARWCGAGDGQLAFAFDGKRPVALPLRESLRAGAEALVAAARRAGIGVAILSGDRAEAAAEVARQLGIEDWTAGCSPADKLVRLERLAADGRRVLMVGDGINDGPALAAAHASVAPGEAVDLSRNAADLVLLGDDLGVVWTARRVARRAHRRILENFAIAATYNAVAVPLALAGFVDPLVAALAMSTSSILVTLNAMRLRLDAPASHLRAAPSTAPIGEPCRA